MVIEDLEINEDLRIDKHLSLTPSTLANITAGGGITVTNSNMRVQGDGGPVAITANPQIVAGTDGQIVYIQGQSDTNTIAIHNGDGLHLHSGNTLIMGEHDYITMQYDEGANLWEELSINFQTFDNSWTFSSPSGSSGTFYVGGFYLFGSTSFTPAGGTTLGSANAAYGAHAFLVLGASSTDMIVRVTGTSVTDAGVRVDPDTEDMDTSGGVADDYFETAKKWVGQISYSLLSGTGVVVNNGLCKYWDNQNNTFKVTGFEVTGNAGANDSSPNFLVRHHKSTGWTYNVGASPTPPAAYADMQTDYNTEFELVINEPFAWKRAGLTEVVVGNTGEGLICEIVTTSNKAIEILNWTYSIRPS